MKFKIDIKDNKVAYVLELLKNLDFVSIEEDQNTDEIFLSDADRKLLDKRLAFINENPQKVHDWDIVKKA